MTTQSVLYFSGRTTDNVMDTGDGVSAHCPIYGNFSSASSHPRLADRDPAVYSMKNLTVQGYSHCRR